MGIAWDCAVIIRSYLVLTPMAALKGAGALVNETYEVASLLLAQLPDVPEDASAVVIPGPTRPLFTNELAAIRRYVDRGGAVLMAIDPRAQTNVYELLEGWGVILGDDVVVDRALAVFGQATTPMAEAYDGAHPITERLREREEFRELQSEMLDHTNAERAKLGWEPVAP